MLLRYAFQEVHHALRFSWLFVFNLALGLSGFVVLTTFEASIQTTIADRSKAIYGADLGTRSRRSIREAEREIIESHLGDSFQHTQVIELYSMIAAESGQSRLVRIKSIDDVYPFYGQIQVSSTHGTLESLNQALNESSTWVSPELLVQMGLQVGQTLKVGAMHLGIAGEIVEDSTAGLASSWAPTIYLSQDALAQTDLLKMGSIAWYSELYRVPGATLAELETKAEQLFAQLDDPDVQVRTHQSASERIGRWLTLLNDFLGLVALVALFLSTIASGFLIRTYLTGKLASIAILRSLGLTPNQTFILYSVQVATLGVISAVIALGLAWLLLPMLVDLLAGLMPLAVHIQLPVEAVLIALGMGSLGSLLVALPFLASLRSVRPALLLGEARSASSLGQAVNLGRFRRWLLWLPGFSLFWGLAIYQADSIVVGSLFIAMCVAMVFVLSALYWLLFVKLGQVVSVNSNPLRWALRDLARYRLAGSMIFICLGLGVTLLNVIPQLKSAIFSELADSDHKNLPDVFMLDIQPEQLEAVQRLVEESGHQLQEMAPMTRARFVAVNDQRFSKGEGESAAFTREAQAEARFRNRGVNLSYRAELSSSERLVAGQWFSDEGSKEPEISLEMEYAERLGLKLGDKLTFDIEGIEISGWVTSMRKVKWGSFQPNFFIIFEPGVLELAPKTFLATLSTSSSVQKADFQNHLVSVLPNVTLVDVDQLIQKLRTFLDQMRWALQYMSGLCVLAGLLVLYSIANYQAQSRVWQVALLKSLGARFAEVYATLVLQFALVAVLAAVFGGVVGCFFSWVIAVVVFQGLWVFEWQMPLLLGAGLVLVSVLVASIAVWKTLKMPPTRLLNG